MAERTLERVVEPEVVPADPVDTVRIEAAVREILWALGEDPDRDGLRETPARVARSYRDLFRGLREDPRDALSTQFDVAHDEIVLVKGIRVNSVCEHHLLPFTGVAHVGYVPGVHGKVAGLSKLARVVDGFARRPQVQERLTTQIADALVECLDPAGVAVVIECEHFCMSMRGVEKEGATTLTSVLRGCFREPVTRQELMQLIRG